jgi:hypothetical protein
MEVEHPKLIVDEKLFLLALRTLTDLESEGEKFSLLRAVVPFTNEDDLGARFSLAADREIEADDKRAIRYYVEATYLVSHHRASLEDLEEVFSELTPSVAEFVRMAAWAFLSAWNFRYGGVYASRVVHHTLVDPAEPT